MVLIGFVYLINKRTRLEVEGEICRTWAKANELEPSPTTSLNVLSDHIIFGPLESENSLNLISRLSLEDNAVLDVEDTLRSTTEIVFPVMDHGIELSYDFSIYPLLDDIL